MFVSSKGCIWPVPFDLLTVSEFVFRVVVNIWHVAHLTNNALIMHLNALYAQLTKQGREWREIIVGTEHHAAFLERVKDRGGHVSCWTVCGKYPSQASIVLKSWSPYSRGKLDGLSRTRSNCVFMWDT